jgi:tRNA threonylcarbamoyl adenosine modification protein (Sua5/YciO/YrdC/YwlC family)
VYGLGADAFDAVAVADLLRVKGRGRDMPVPVLVGSWSTVDGLVSAVDSRTRTLVEAFWPGGLTLVVRHAPSLTWDLGDARGTVAVRMPLHPVAIELLEQTGPMAVSSANRHGQPAAQTALEARSLLGEDVAVYLEDGQASGGVASTIVDVTGSRPHILRLGAVGVDALREVVPDIVDSTNPAEAGR